MRIKYRPTPETERLKIIARRSMNAVMSGENKAETTKGETSTFVSLETIREVAEAFPNAEVRFSDLQLVEQIKQNFRKSAAILSSLTPEQKEYFDHCIRISEKESHGSGYEKGRQKTAQPYFNVGLTTGAAAVSTLWFITAMLEHADNPFPHGGFWPALAVVAGLWAASGICSKKLP
jgi:hypothetical protein